MNIADDLYKEILKSLPILCVDLLIVHKKQCLLLQRDNEPAKGQLWFPGGRVFKNELIKDAAVRKAKEEVNLNSVFVKIISVEETLFPKEDTMNTDIHTVNVCCLMEAASVDELFIDKLHSSYKWVTSIPSNLHPGVAHPLQLMGFKY